MSAGDNWCTDTRELDLVEKICGVREWHLDPATNTHSRVPALIACHGGPALARLPQLPAQPAFPGGRLRMKVDGLSFEWPTAWDVWENPPYSDPAGWVAQALWHACAGGRGVALLPGTLDTFWGQAVLKARTSAEAALHTVFKTPSARTTAAYPRFSQLGRVWTPTESGDATGRLAWLISWQVLMLCRRVSFRDPERPWHGPVPGNRGSSMLVFWGFDPLECDPEIGEWL